MVKLLLLLLILLLILCIDELEVLIVFAVGVDDDGGVLIVEVIVDVAVAFLSLVKLLFKRWDGELGGTCC